MGCSWAVAKPAHVQQVIINNIYGIGSMGRLLRGA